ncbi:MAG TPA: neutral/alkaline non-lysosomal ceramidase N-terminal domain-containing protein [Chryseolinea sp.]|nr:neutral/alkaline non-lysosomal ceramidase N-terminal domain-containing protein [Chryseolinea sp.]
MNLLFRSARFAFSLLFALITFQSTGQSSKSTLLAGAATINITPSVPVPMSGYANRSEPSKGVHDEIFARAFVFDDGMTKACIVQADLIGFSFEFVDEISAGIEKQTAIPKANIMLVAVHNHSAPTTGAYAETLSNDLATYLTELKKKLVNVAVEAFKQRAPVSIGFGKGICTMNINRRARHAEGGIWLGRNPDGICDHDVAVARIDDANANVKGLFVNWPCHATVGGQENYLISGDWPGSTARYVNKHFQDVPVAVTAGASGDINPIYGPGNDFRETDAVGLVLGEEVVKIAANITTQKMGNVKTMQREIEVPGKERSATRMPGEKIIPGKTVKLRFSLVKVGPIVFAGISGELMTSIGMKIKKESPFNNTILLTHCNGSSGYLCTDEAYVEGGYEPMASRTMPGTEKIITSTFAEMLNGL